MKYDEEWLTTGPHTKRLRGHRIGIEKPFKAPKIVQDETIAICLSCDKPTCKGNCEEVRFASAK